MRTAWEAVAKALLNSRHTGLTPLASSTKRLTVEGCQVGETGFPVYKSMQFTSSHLLVFRSLEMVSIQKQVVGVFYLIVFTSKYL